jgi:hypothetical protein
MSEWYDDKGKKKGFLNGRELTALSIVEGWKHLTNESDLWAYYVYVPKKGFLCECDEEKDKFFLNCLDACGFNQKKFAINSAKRYKESIIYSLRLQKELKE